MKAIVRTRYGSPDVLQLKEIATPTPADEEVLIKVYAASVNPLDKYLMRGGPFFLRLMLGRLTPKHEVLGCDIAGRVESGRQPRKAVSAGRRGVRRKRQTVRVGLPSMRVPLKIHWR